MAAARWSIAVLGPGGVGGLLGALLARDGHRVTCLAGSSTAAALREGGISVQSGQYGEFAVRVDADTDLREPVDAVLITVKATALDDALERLPAEALGPGLVVPLLNGVEHMTVLRERYPAEQVVAGAIRVASSRVAPGRIVHSTPFTLVDLASRTAPRSSVDDVATRLDEAGLEVTVRDDETTMLWDKLAFLAALALLTTRYEAPAGEIRTKHRDLLLATVDEIVSVAQAEGARANTGDVMALFDRLPVDMTSSMQRDAQAGLPLELDAIGGAVVNAAARHDLAVPNTARLVAELEAREGA